MKRLPLAERDRRRGVDLPPRRIMTHGARGSGRERRRNSKRRAGENDHCDRDPESVSGVHNSLLLASIEIVGFIPNRLLTSRLARPADVHKSFSKSERHPALALGKKSLIRGQIFPSS
jgi:hypothetical protein